MPNQNASAGAMKWLTLTISYKVTNIRLVSRRAQMEKQERRRSPQENKRLSYERDCVNTYGENNKAARKSIRRFKAASNRAGRRGVNRALLGLEHDPEELAHETALVQAEHLALKPEQQKVPDAPLKDVVPHRTRREVPWATSLRPQLEEIGATGVSSLKEVAAELQRRCIATPTGKPWSSWLVQQALRRLGVREPWEWRGKF